MIKHNNLFLLVLTALTITSGMLMAQNNKENQSYHLLVGTYTTGKSEGIYTYRFDSQTGKLTLEHTQSEVINPSYLTMSPDNRYVYAANELFEGMGRVSAFQFDQKSGKLTFINQQSSEGAAPCYITTDKGQQHVIVGNYGGGLSVLPVEKDGSLGAAIQIIHHEGSSINKSRQEGSHVHATVFSPDGNYLFVVDLGTDKVYAYSYNAQDEAPLKPASAPFTGIASGSGPRHITFSPSGKHAYVIQELTAEVTAYDYNDGKLSHIQTISMTAPDFKGEVGAAAIHISPDGKFLYASNRLDANDIAIYKINAKKGTLKLVGRQSTLGKAPRDFVIDPTGQFLLAANQNSDKIVVFKRDKKTGELSPTGTEIEIGNPVYLKMVPVSQ